MDDKKKRFVIPNAEIVSFTNADIITVSGGGVLGMSIDDDTDKEEFLREDA